MKAVISAIHQQASNYKYLILLFYIFVLVSPPISAKEAGGFLSQETLTGMWGGARQKMVDKGINLEVVYTGDVHANVSGGVQREADYLHSATFGLSLDLETLLKWKGAAATIVGEGNWGGSPGSNSGDAQGISNIDAENFWHVQLAILEQNFFDGNLSIAAGIYDVAADFDVIESGGLFIGSSHGTGPDLSQSGQNGPSIWPYPGLGARMRYKPHERVYIQVAATEGAPGNLGDPKDGLPHFDGGEGVFIIGEAGYVIREIDDEDADRPYGKFNLGGWYYTADFDDVLDVDGAGNPRRHGGNYGIYAAGEYQVFREAGSQTQGLNIYVRLGLANDDFNQFGYYTGGGVVYTGAIPSRDEDQIGLGIAAAHNGSKFKTAMTQAGTPVQSSEINLELTYRAQLTPFFAIQPDVQYIMNPGTDPTLDNALSVGGRFELSF